MNIGMLWFDNDPRTAMEVKIERAVHYYANKYGATPDLCFVHPTMLLREGKVANPVQPLHSGAVEVRPAHSVLPNHFWIGMRATADGSSSAGK